MLVVHGTRVVRGMPELRGMLEVCGMMPEVCGMMPELCGTMLELCGMLELSGMLFGIASPGLQPCPSSSRRVPGGHRHS